MSTVTFRQIDHTPKSPAVAHYELRCEDWLPRPIDDVFSFFSDAYNLERITPDFLRFHVLRCSDRIVMRGSVIDYRLRLHGIPFRWRTVIDEWIPGVRFVDRQVHGPFKLWHHTHEFEHRDGGTLIRDRVLYDLPLGALGRIVAARIVRRDVEEIFRHRQRRTHALLGSA